MEPASTTRAAEIVPILRTRDGQETTISLADGRVLNVFNIAWGIDEGEDYEHITINISPEVKGASIDSFLTREVWSVAATETGQPAWTRG